MRGSVSKLRALWEKGSAGLKPNRAVDLENEGQVLQRVSAFETLHAAAKKAASDFKFKPRNQPSSENQPPSEMETADEPAPAPDCCCFPLAQKIKRLF